MLASNRVECCPEPFQMQAATYISVAIEGDIANGWTDEQEKAIDTKRKAETEERKKEREEEEKRKRQREEMNRVFEVFQSQSESMQDVILDIVEMKMQSPQMPLELSLDIIDFMDKVRDKMRLRYPFE